MLCDRFTDSTIAYQGFGRGLSLELIQQLKTLVQQQLEPDCTFWLDAPVSVGMARARCRAETAGEAIDRFETEQQAFFERVYQGFAQLATSESRFRRIDASVSLDEVQQALLAALTPLLPEVL